MCMNSKFKQNDHTANATITIPTYRGKDKTYSLPTAPEIAAAIPQQSGNIENQSYPPNNTL